MSKKKSGQPGKGRKAAAPPAAAATRGPARFGTKPWQSGKPHLTPAQLAGKSRKVH